MYNEDALEKLKGQTVVEIDGMKEGSEEVTLKTKEGNTLVLRYEHDCCASCSICQVDGDPMDLLGAKLLMCETVTGASIGVDEDLDESGNDPGEYDSHTWTFVKFASVHGYVTLRWYGSSNGYYSESPTAYYNPKNGETGRW